MRCGAGVIGTRLATVERKDRHQCLDRPAWRPNRRPRVMKKCAQSTCPLSRLVINAAAFMLSDVAAGVAAEITYVDGDFSHATIASGGDSGGDSGG